MLVTQAWVGHFLLHFPHIPQALLVQPPAELRGHLLAGIGQLGAIFVEAGKYAPSTKLGSSAMLLDVIRAPIVNISDRFEEPIQQCGAIFRCRIAVVGNFVLMRINTSKGPAVAGRDRGAKGLQILRAAFKDGLRRKLFISRNPSHEDNGERRESTP